MSSPASPPATPAGPRPAATRPATSAPRPVAGRSAVVGALATGVGAAVFLRAGAPGVGIALFSLTCAAVAVAVRSSAPLRGWRTVHGSAAVLLAGAAALRDAPWVVLPDVLAAALLAALAVTPAGTWPSVLLAPARACARTPLALAWLVRGVRPAAAQRSWWGPWLRGLAVTALLLVVFVPLLASADARFAALVPPLPDLGALPGRVALLALGTVAGGSALFARAHAPGEVTLPAPARLLRRPSEWLLPLGALDVVLGVFVALQSGRREASTTYAGAVHAGFFQLVAATALVLVVVAAAVRWTTRSRGVRGALGVLCGLTLAVDGVAVARLHAYTVAYGLTRLRIGVAAVCVFLAVVLLLLLVAGATRRRSGWVPHAVVAVAAATLVALTAADPDAAIGRSILDRGGAADTAYAATLSADAVPVLVHLPPAQRGCVLAAVTLAEPGPWTSANLARARARRLLASTHVSCASS